VIVGLQNSFVVEIGSLFLVIELLNMFDQIVGYFCQRLKTCVANPGLSVGFISLLGFEFATFLANDVQLIASHPNLSIIVNQSYSSISSFVLRIYHVAEQR